MPETTDAIADVILRHQPNEWGQHDGWWECCCSHDATVPWSPTHVADAIRASLGLTEERSVTGGPGVGPVTRLVSDWRPVDA